MKKVLSVLILSLMGSAGFAQGFVGDWSGILSFGGAKLHIVFHITKSGDVYKSTMDSPDQGARGLAVGATTVEGNHITINASAYGINYTGTYLPDSNKINGSFPQGGNNIPLNFTWSKPTAALAARPQDPKDFPYKQEEVAFTNPKAGDRLAGTLTMPADGKATKIVIMITGSGPENRNEEIFNHRPFLIWSDWLTRHGIAVLRYDDRGIAESTGNFNTATSADFADDVEAAISFIQSRADLKNLSIGLMGHSEGGMIAPMVASRNNAVKFIVLLAGPGVPTLQLMVKQTADLMKGAPAAAIERSVNRNKKLYEIIVQNPNASTSQLQQQILPILYQDMHDHPGGGIDSTNIKEVIQGYSQLLTPWMRYFFAVDPAVYLTKVQCPVLALNGTLDMQVNAEANLAGIKAGLQKGGNTKYEIISLPGLNHLLQKATTGSVPEYETIEETVDPMALNAVIGWINKLQQ